MKNMGALQNLTVGEGINLILVDLILKGNMRQASKERENILIFVPSHGVGWRNTVSLFFWNFECSLWELMFLWNNCQLFPMLFYNWNTGIKGSIQYLIFLGDISWKETSFFITKDAVFQKRPLHNGIFYLCNREHFKFPLSPSKKLVLFVSMKTL